MLYGNTEGCIIRASLRGTRTPMPTFSDKLAEASKRNNSLLCVGLDPDPALMPEMEVAAFNRAIVEATQDLVCAYKPNLAFYEALGMKGFEALRETIDCIPSHIPIVGDCKRGDIGNTARAYAGAMFEQWGFDAVTVSPYLGWDSIEPYCRYEDKGVLVLCRTSNKGGADFQDLSFQGPDGVSLPLYEWVATKVQEWDTRGNLGLVVGATQPEELRRARELCPDMPILVPGIGTQAGDLAAAVRYGTDRDGMKAMISSSRKVLYASRGSDFADAAREACVSLRDQMQEALASRSSA